MHCWQGDDVSGFENPEGSLTGGIQATNYPGKARNASELRADLEQAIRLFGAETAIYMPSIWNQTRPSRAIDQTRALQNWVEWAKTNQLGLVCPSCFRIR